MDSADVVTRNLPRTARGIWDGIETGLHPGLQVYVSVEGEPVAEGAFGEAAPGRPLTRESLVAWLSSGKPLTALLLLQRVERGECRLNDPVVRFLPEFAPQGKSGITLWHLLTHTAGLLPGPTGWPQEDWDAIIARICQTRLRHNWVIGEQGAYDPARSWFLLGAILQRIDGRCYEQIVREDLCEPIGMSDTWLSLPAERVERYADRLAVLHSCDAAGCRPAATLPAQFGTPSPGGSLHGPARDLGRFYELLLSEGSWYGIQIVRPETVAAFRSPQRVGLFDLTFQHTVDFGLGVIIDSNRYGAETVPYGFGPHCSPATFGHGGAQSSIAFADPRHRLVVVLIANGAPGEAAHQARHRRLCAAVYEDLGLA